MTFVNGFNKHSNRSFERSFFYVFLSICHGVMHLNIGLTSFIDYICWPEHRIFPSSSSKTLVGIREFFTPVCMQP